MPRARHVILCLVMGCCLSCLSLQWGSASDSKGKVAVTFSKDAAPVLYKNCVVCHRPNSLAPMSLMTYKDARPWARSIREKVLLREMPPWHADPRFGEFSNARRLSQGEIDTLVAWVDQGAREGDSKDLPPAPSFPDNWGIGKPDAVLSMAEQYTVTADGPDEYIHFTIPTNFKEDKWVQAAEIRPGNRKVVHHVIAFVETPQMLAAEANPVIRRQGEIEPGFFNLEGTLMRLRPDAPVVDDGCNDPSHRSAFRTKMGPAQGLGMLLAGYAPGRQLDAWPSGEAKLLPAGSNIILQIHYSKTTGAVEKDRTSVGLVFSKEPPEKVLRTIPVSNTLFKVPAGAESHEVTACFTFGRDVELVSYMPHMHLRGKDMKYEAVYPDGRRETLLLVPQYNFNWQWLYILKKPLAIPKGTKLVVTAHFDNSVNNKYNPAPAKDVRWGDPTYDEMMIGWLDYSVRNPAPQVASNR